MKAHSLATVSSSTRRGKQKPLPTTIARSVTQAVKLGQQYRCTTCGGNMRMQIDDYCENYVLKCLQCSRHDPRTFVSEKRKR